MMKFKINNTRDIYVIGNYTAIFPVVYFVVVLLSKLFFPQYFAALFYILVAVTAVYSISYVTLIRRQYDVDYDGMCIRYKTSSGEKVIELTKVKSVKYGVIEGYPFRGKRSYIYLEFENINSGEKPVRLYDYVPDKEMEKVMNGFYSGYPLLLMYDDIITKYPDKKSA